MSDLWELFGFVAALVMVVVAVEAVTEILVAGSLLDIIGLRCWVVRKALPEASELDKVKWYYTALHKLFTCGYCSSVWVAGLFAWLLPGDYFGLMPWNNIVVKIFLVHRLANWSHVWYELVRRGRVHTTDAVTRNLIESTPWTVVLKTEGEDARATTRRVRETGEEAGQSDLRPAESEQSERPQSDTTRT